jgi:protein-tyrosine phosphatase
VAFLAEEAATGTVYVHCKIGYSRSAAVVGAYLLASQQAATVDEAVAQLRAVRPSIVVRPEVIEALCAFVRGEKARRSPSQTHGIVEAVDPGLAQCQPS